MKTSRGNGLTERECKMIVSLYVEEELSLAAIARKFRKDKRVIRAVLCDEGIAIRPRGWTPPRSPLSKEERACAVKLYTGRGYSLVRVGRILGRDQEKVREALVSEGVAIRPHGGSKVARREVNPSPFSDSERRRIVNLYSRRNYSLSDTERLFGRRREIREVLESEGVPLRPAVGSYHPRPRTLVQEAVLGTADEVVDHLRAAGMSMGFIGRHVPGPARATQPRPSSQVAADPLSDLIAELYVRRVHSLREIGEMLSLSHITIRRKLITMGVPTRPVGRPRLGSHELMRPARRRAGEATFETTGEAIVHLASIGFSRREIARIFERSSNFVHRRYYAANPMSRSGLPSDLLEMINLYERGVDSPILGLRYYRSPETIRRTLVKYGVEIRLRRSAAAPDVAPIKLEGPLQSDPVADLLNAGHSTFEVSRALRIPLAEVNERFRGIGSLDRTTAEVLRLHRSGQRPALIAAALGIRSDRVARIIRDHRLPAERRRTRP
ncbi:hypothetical protein ACFVUW_10475 [Streptomyces xiamenensis]|uniref:hypothetical protein n=1 Tax=Streptomyces xiamenensis TaxID=408015 RepID=UPI0036EC4B81